MELKVGSLLVYSRIWAMGIGLFELAISAIGLFIFTLGQFDSDKWGCWLPIPDELLPNETLTKVVRNVLLLVCILQLFMGLVLFEGARTMNRGRVRFWLVGILYFVIMSSIIIVSIEIVGVKDAKFNAVAFLNIAIRFIEVLLVYIHLQELKTIQSNNNRIGGIILSGKSIKSLENSELSLISSSK